MNELQLLVGYRFRSLVRRESDWVVTFDREASLVVACLWRLVESGHIQFTSADDGHQFGLPAPVDAVAEVNARLAGAAIEAVELREGLLDLELRFCSGYRLQIIPESSGYEAWNLCIGNRQFIAVGGGELVVFGADRAADLPAQMRPVSERKRPIELAINATLVIDPRDAAVIAEWDIEQLRHLVFEICESTAVVVLPKGSRGTVRFISPTPFDLKAAELGDESLATMFVPPLQDEPDVQVVARWRYGLASLYEVLVLRRLLPAVRMWQPSEAIERARASSHWVLAVGQRDRAARMLAEANRAGLVAVAEPFVPPDGQTPEQFGAYWGCEVPQSWWPR